MKDNQQLKIDLMETYMNWYTDNVVDENEHWTKEELKKEFIKDVTKIVESLLW